MRGVLGIVRSRLVLGQVEVGRSDGRGRASWLLLAGEAFVGARRAGGVFGMSGGAASGVHQRAEANCALERRDWARDVYAHQNSGVRRFGAFCALLLVLLLNPLTREGYVMGVLLLRSPPA